MPPFPFIKAEKHLSTADPVMAGLIQNLGPCKLQLDSDWFRVLVKTIIYQSISTKAATTIISRVENALGDRGYSPGLFRRWSVEKFSSLGVPARKSNAILSVARDQGTKNQGLLERFGGDGKKASEYLLSFKGIGPWSVEMVQIFSLGLEDILPVKDFGIRLSISQLYSAEKLSDRELLEFGRKWAPFRTIATWYLWRNLGPVPQS